MRVSGASMIISFASRVVYVPIGCRHPFIKYWQPLLAKSTATCSLLHPENMRQQSISNFQLPILSNLSSDWLQTSVHQILAAFTGKNTSDMLPVAS